MLFLSFINNDDFVSSRFTVVCFKLSFGCLAEAYEQRELLESTSRNKRVIKF